MGTLSSDASLVKCANSNDYGKTLLHYAGGFDCCAVIKRLIELGADPNARGTDGETPIFRCARFGKVNAIRALLEAPDDRVDKDAQDVSGNTALHVAAKTSKPLAVELLLERGARITENNKGETPLDVAAVSG